MTKKVTNEDLVVEFREDEDKVFFYAKLFPTDIPDAGGVVHADGDIDRAIDTFNRERLKYAYCYLNRKENETNPIICGQHSELVRREGWVRTEGFLYKGLKSSKELMKFVKMGGKIIANTVGRAEQSLRLNGVRVVNGYKIDYINFQKLEDVQQGTKEGETHSKEEEDKNE